MEREISSRTNPLIGHIRRLGADAAYRRSEGLYLCDGLTLLHEALAAPVPPSEVIAAQGTDLPPLPPETMLTRLPPALLRAVAPTEQPQGVLTLCKRPAPLSAPPAKGCYLFLERVQDPGNVGSLLRTADAFGLDGVYLSEDTADAFHPKTVRAAMGALFRLPVGQTDADTLLGGTVPLWAAAPHTGDAAVGQVCFPKQLILALGNEGRGLSPNILNRAARTVGIPMRGGAESLGVAAAGAILIWEFTERGHLPCLP